MKTSLCYNQNLVARLITVAIFYLYPEKIFYWRREISKAEKIQLPIYWRLNFKIYYKKRNPDTKNT